MTTTLDPGTPTWMRAHNDRTAFRLLLEHGPLSRSALGSLSGLSKPTAGQMILRLERLGLVEPVGEHAVGRGPNAVVYGIRRDVVTGVAVSILADTIEAAVVDVTGEARPVAVLAVTPGDRTPEADIDEAIVAACAAAGVDRATVQTVVIGVQAAVDVAGDGLSFTDTLPGWPRTGARARIEASTGLHVVLDNDVNLAAAAERARGGIVGDLPGFAYLWLGDGLGLGLDIDSKIQRGASGGAGEIGYLEVPASAAALDPAAADFTDLLGGPAVARVLTGTDVPLADALATTPSDAPQWAAVADRVTALLRPVVALLDPAAIVLGGPTGAAGGLELAAAVQERIDHLHAQRPEVRAVDPHIAVLPAASGRDAVLLGARHLVSAHLRARLETLIATP